MMVEKEQRKGLTGKGRESRKMREHHPSGQILSMRYSPAGLLASLAFGEAGGSLAYSCSLSMKEMDYGEVRPRETSSWKGALKRVGWWGEAATNLVSKMWTAMVD